MNSKILLRCLKCGVLCTDPRRHSQTHSLSLDQVTYKQIENEDGPIRVNRTPRTKAERDKLIMTMQAHHVARQQVMQQRAMDQSLSHFKSLQDRDDQQRSFEDVRVLKRYETQQRELTFYRRLLIALVSAMLFVLLVSMVKHQDKVIDFQDWVLASAGFELSPSVEEFKECDQHWRQISQHAAVLFENDFVNNRHLEFKVDLLDKVARLAPSRWLTYLRNALEHLEFCVDVIAKIAGKAQRIQFVNGPCLNQLFNL